MNDVIADISSLSGADIAAMSPKEAGEALARFEAASRPAPSAEPKTVNEALARRAALERDPEFLARLQRGDVASTEEFTKLNTMIAEGASPVDMAMAGLIPSGHLGETTTPENPTTVRTMALMAETYREWGLNEACVMEALEGAKHPPHIYREAMNRRAERMGDPEWTKRLLAGDFAANKEFVLLSSILAGEVVSASEAEAHEKRLMARVGGR
jgi:hypothetical protein